MTDDTLPRTAPGHAREDVDAARVAELFEAGMVGDVVAWDLGLTLWYDQRLGEDERSRFLATGGPPPLALERQLARLSTHVRPPGHLERLRDVVENYWRAMDGDREALTWVEAARGHPSGSLGRVALLGADGLPVPPADLTAGLEPGPLPDGWLTDPRGVDLAHVCHVPHEQQPVWVQLHVAMGRPLRP